MPNITVPRVSFPPCFSPIPAKSTSIRVRIEPDLSYLGSWIFSKLCLLNFFDPSSKPKVEQDSEPELQVRDWRRGTRIGSRAYIKYEMESMAGCDTNQSLSNLIIKLPSQRNYRSLGWVRARSSGRLTVIMWWDPAAHKKLQSLLLRLLKSLVAFKSFIATYWDLWRSFSKINYEDIVV